MARMRGPDYGSMLRAIYEPKLQRQTAKENFKLKQDALNEQIRTNKAREQQAKLDAEQRLAIAGSYKDRTADVVAGREDVQAHDVSMLNKKSMVEAISDARRQGYAQDNLNLGGRITRTNMRLGQDFALDRLKKTQDFTAGESLLGRAHAITMQDDQQDYLTGAQDIDYQNKLILQQLDADNRRGLLEYQYEGVPLDPIVAAQLKERGYNVEGAKVPRSQQAAGFGALTQIMGMEGSYEKAVDQLNIKEAKTMKTAMGAAPQWSDFKGSEQTKDPLFADEQEIHDSMKLFDEKMQLPTPSGITPWTRAQQSFDPEYGDVQYGDNVIKQYETMLKETGKDYMQNQNFLGMDIWPGERSIEKSRTLLRKRLKSLYQHKYDYLKAKNSKYVKDLDLKGYTKKYAPALY